MSSINDLLNHANNNKPADFSSDFKLILKDRILNKLSPTEDSEEDNNTDDKAVDEE